MCIVGPTPRELCTDHILLSFLYNEFHLNLFKKAAQDLGDCHWVEDFGTNSKDYEIIWSEAKMTIFGPWPSDAPFEGNLYVCCLTSSSFLLSMDKRQMIGMENVSSFLGLTDKINETWMDLCSGMHWVKPNRFLDCSSLEQLWNQLACRWGKGHHI